MKTKILSILFALTLCFSFSVEKANAQYLLLTGHILDLTRPSGFSTSRNGLNKLTK